MFLLRVYKVFEVFCSSLIKQKFVELKASIFMLPCVSWIWFNDGTVSALSECVWLTDRPLMMQRECVVCEHGVIIDFYWSLSYLQSGPCLSHTHTHTLPHRHLSCSDRAENRSSAMTHDWLDTKSRLLSLNIHLVLTPPRGRRRFFIKCSLAISVNNIIKKTHGTDTVRKSALR